MHQGPGGGGVAIDLVLAEKVSVAYLNDSSKHIYAFWHSVLGRTEDFCRRVSVASLSVEEWKKHREVVRNPDDHSLFDLGFSTFYLNRTNRSGVLSGGVIGGLAQTGRWRIDARFPRNELIRRIEAIADYSDRIIPSNLDAEQFLEETVGKLPVEQTLVYCDPPYYERSQRLYPAWYQKDDHARLAETIQSSLHHLWVVSYDGHPDLMSLYDSRRMFVYSLQYSATRAYRGSEVFIFADDLHLPSSSMVSSVNDALLAAGF